MLKKILQYLAFLIVIPSLILNAYFLLKTNNKNPEATVYIRDVIDGDTLVTETGSRIRLLRADAPELEYCFGKESKDRLAELVTGKRVVLKDQVGDGLKRILALVYVDGTLVNEVMLREGFLRYQGGSSSEKDKLQAAADEARKNQAGIYSQKCRQTKNLDNPKCIIKGNISKSDDKKTYHFPGCSGYDTNIVVEKDLGDQWFCSEKEAQAAGFVKSETCYGKSFR